MTQISEKKKEVFSFGIMMLLVVGITGMPYLKDGLLGWVPDLMYHLLRIEGVKEALLGEKILPEIYQLFFAGYGYGSSLFYPDIFLIYPAVLRIIGFGPLATWKIFALSITAIATCTTYLSFKYISKNWKFSMAGTYLLMLSQFYLADLINRLGISEYLAFVFMPVLFAGIYDFFAYEGKKMYLMGIAFVGLVLSHTIMTFLGVMLTGVVFVGGLFFPASRRKILNKKKICRLGITALVTVLSVSYYLFPMLEQMLDGEFKYATPWTFVGQNTQPVEVFFRLTGYFDRIAYVGVGIPVLILIVCCLFYRKVQNKWAYVFLFGGIGLFVITTDIIPWERFNNTFLNMIQFTYRLYPYALCAVCLGIVLILSEKCKKHVDVVVAFIMGLSLVFGFWQNYSLQWDSLTEAVTEEYLYEHTNYVGMGEWLPTNYSKWVVELDASDKIWSPGGELDLIKEDYNQYSFVAAQPDCDTYVLPLMYYKGYEAILHTNTGECVELPVLRNDSALVQVLNESGLTGTVEVSYAGTTVQKISDIISLLTLCGVIIYLWKRNTKSMKN